LYSNLSNVYLNILLIYNNLREVTSSIWEYGNLELIYSDEVGFREGNYRVKKSTLIESAFNEWEYLTQS
jgi:hypothetical protein